MVSISLKTPIDALCHRCRARDRVESLAAAQKDELEQLARADDRFDAIRLLRAALPGLGLYDAVEMFESCRSALGISTPSSRAAAKLSVHELLLSLREQPTTAIEARWDGDTAGWFIVLEAIVKRPSSDHPRYAAVHLAILDDPRGDMRLFNGVVPPWPEAERATVAGEELARQLGVPFHFPSPNAPDDQAPRWWSLK